MKLRERTKEQRAALEKSDAEYLSGVSAKLRASEAARLSAYREMEASLEDDEELFYPGGVDPNDIIRDCIYVQKRKKDPQP